MKQLFSEARYHVPAAAVIDSEGYGDGHCSSALPEYRDSPAVSAFREDLIRIIDYMAKSQDRIDHLVRLSIAMSRIKRSKLKREDHRNMRVLTALLSFFLPLILLASVLSMNADTRGLYGTVRIWAASAVPADALISSWGCCPSSWCRELGDG